MLNSVSVESTARLREARLLLNLIKQLQNDAGFRTSPAITTSKGLFFVQLYGCLEYTTVASVQLALLSIANMKHKVSAFKPAMLSVILDAECNAASTVHRRSLWEKRRDLFNRLLPGTIPKINDSLLPSDGSNIRYGQLESIWASSCVSGSVLPRQSLRGRLDEVVNNRNSIAHGRETASSIGGRYSANDLEQHLVDVKEVCEHIVQTFDRYLIEKHFLRRNK